MATPKGRRLTVGARVVFKDRFDDVHFGTIESFDMTGATSANVHLKDVTDKDGKPTTTGYVVSNRHVTFPDTPLAKAWLTVWPHYRPGTVVRVTLTPREQQKRFGGLGHGDLGVVLQDKGDRVNVAVLGGATGTKGGDTYARFTHSVLSEVPLTDLAIVLTTLAAA